MYGGGGGGGRGNFLTALKKFSARKGVNNYKEKWKVVASKETTLTVQVLFPIYSQVFVS